MVEKSIKTKAHAIAAATLSLLVGTSAMAYEIPLMKVNKNGDLQVNLIALAGDEVNFRMGGTDIDHESNWTYEANGVSGVVPEFTGGVRIFAGQSSRPHYIKLEYMGLDDTLKVQGGLGPDTLFIGDESYVNGQVFINMRSGDDHIDMNQSYFEGDGVVSTGNGNDDVTLTGSYFRPSLLLSQGDDTLSVNEESWMDYTKLKASHGYDQHFLAGHHSIEERGATDHGFESLLYDTFGYNYAINNLPLESNLAYEPVSFDFECSRSFHDEETGDGYLGDGYVNIRKSSDGSDNYALTIVKEIDGAGAYATRYPYYGLGGCYVINDYSTDAKFDFPSCESLRIDNVAPQVSLSTSEANQVAVMLGCPVELK